MMFMTAEMRLLSYVFITANIYISGIFALSSEGFFNVVCGQTFLKENAALCYNGMTTLTECAAQCAQRRECCAATYHHGKELCCLYDPAYYHQASLQYDPSWCAINLEYRDTDKSIIEYPMSCAEVKGSHPCAVDGEYCLAVSGLTSATHGLRVYCNDMNGNPEEYITLPAGPDENFVVTHKIAGYPHGEARFSKIGINLDGLTVNAGDFTFANVTLNGNMNTPINAHNYDSYPLYGRTADCSYGADGHAKINLEATGFFIPPEVQFAPRNQAEHNTVMNTRSSSNQRVETQCGGMCSGCDPQKDGSFIYRAETDVTTGKLPVAYDVNLDPMPCTFT